MNEHHDAADVHAAPRAVRRTHAGLRSTRLPRPALTRRWLGVPFLPFLVLFPLHSHLALPTLALTLTAFQMQ